MNNFVLIDINFDTKAMLFIASFSNSILNLFI